MDCESQLQKNERDRGAFCTRGAIQQVSSMTRNHPRAQKPPRKRAGMHEHVQLYACVFFLRLTATDATITLRVIPGRNQNSRGPIHPRPQSEQSWSYIHPRPQSEQSWPHLSTAIATFSPTPHVSAAGECASKTTDISLHGVITLWQRRCSALTSPAAGAACSPPATW